MKRSKWFPLVMLVLIGAVIWAIYRNWTNKPMIVGLKGYSPYNTTAMPAAPAGQSHTMGGGVQAR